LSLPGTLSPSDAQSILWDVVVIGAGVAGSVAAREVARAGYRVLLVDKRQFPRRKVCGACLNDVALDIFAQVQLSGDIDKLGGSRLKDFTLRCGRQSISVPLPGGVAISREALDVMLIRAAIAARVEFLPDVIARVGDNTTDSRIVRLQQAGSETCISAKAIVVASGLEGTSLSGSGEWTTRVAASSRIGAGCLIADDSENYSAGTIWMATGAGGYAGLVRVEDGQLNIAGAFDRNELRRHGSPALATKCLLEKSRFAVPEQLLMADWQGTVPLTRTTMPVSSFRVFLIGDAAGYVEPFTGEGMAWGLLTAQQVTHRVHQAVSQRDWSEVMANGWITDYRRLVQRRQRFCRLWARLLRSPTLISMAMSAFSAWPSLARRVIERVNTRSDQGRLTNECRS
jgi:flavin-dependent dehydrogenase